MNVAVFRHSLSDGLGTLSNVLSKLGLDFNYIDTYLHGTGDFDPHFDGLLIVLGGAPGVYQAEDYPFIKEEVSILEKRLAADLPTLGICLGAQMMAKALGADVYKGEQGIERGWHYLNVNEAGMKTAAKHLDVSRTKMLQWHGDTFDLPNGATLLASSPLYKNQVFSCGKNAMALQCHPEVSDFTVQNWIISGAGAAAEGKFDPQQMRLDTKENISTLEKQTEKFFTEWVAGLEGKS